MRFKALEAGKRARSDPNRRGPRAHPSAYLPPLLEAEKRVPSRDVRPPDRTHDDRPSSSRGRKEGMTDRRGRCEACGVVLPRGARGRRCAVCRTAEAEGRVCSGCGRTYRPEEEGMIQCDLCQRWVHEPCCALARAIMALPPERRETVSYSCPACQVVGADPGRGRAGDPVVKRAGKGLSGKRGRSKQRSPVRAEGKRSVSSGGRPEGCLACARPCDGTTDTSVRCVSCLRWIHSGCTGLGSRTRPFGPDAVGADRYACPSCIRGIVPPARRSRGTESAHEGGGRPRKRVKVDRSHGTSEVSDRRPGRGPAGRIPGVKGGSTRRKLSGSAQADQRKKGRHKCAICGRPASPGREEALACRRCGRPVHASCDGHASTVLEQRRRGVQSDPYRCPGCVASAEPTLKRKASSRPIHEGSDGENHKGCKRSKGGATKKNASGRGSGVIKTQDPSQASAPTKARSNKALKVGGGRASPGEPSHGDREAVKPDPKPQGTGALVTSRVAMFPSNRKFDLGALMESCKPSLPRKPKGKYSIFAERNGLRNAKEAKEAWERAVPEERQACEQAEAREQDRHVEAQKDHAKMVEEWNQASVLTGIFPFLGTNGSVKGANLLLSLEQALLEYLKRADVVAGNGQETRIEDVPAHPVVSLDIQKEVVSDPSSCPPHLDRPALVPAESIPDQVQVTCGQLSGTFLTGSMRVRTEEGEMSAREFEKLAGLGPAKKWKTSLKTLDGKKIGDLLVRLGLSSPPVPKAAKDAPPRLKETSRKNTFAPPATYSPWHETALPSFSPIAAHWASDRCAVCFEDREYDVDQLVSCEDCRVTVHQSCYGIPRVPGPEETWLCQACIQVRWTGTAVRRVHQLLDRVAAGNCTKKRVSVEKLVDDVLEDAQDAEPTGLDRAWRRLQRLVLRRLCSAIDYSLPLLEELEEAERLRCVGAFRAQAGAILRRPQCCLCPVGGGALKRTEVPGVWAHWSCGMYIAESYIENIERMEPICGIRGIARDRWDLPCTLCRRRVGAKIQCAAACYSSYHTTCARMSGQRFEARIINGKDPDAPLRLLSYCGKHGGTNPLLATPVKVENDALHGLGWAAVAEDIGVRIQAMICSATQALAGFGTAAGAARCQPVDEEWQRESHGTGIASVSGGSAFWLPRYSLPGPRQAKQKGIASSKLCRPSRVHQAPDRPQDELLPLPAGLPEVVPVYCSTVAGVLLVRASLVKLGDGGMVSPSDFERLAGASRAKKWRTSLKLGRFNEAGISILDSLCVPKDDALAEDGLQGIHVLELYDRISSEFVLFGGEAEKSIGDYLTENGLCHKQQAHLKSDWTCREYWIRKQSGMLVKTDVSDLPTLVKQTEHVEAASPNARGANLVAIGLVVHPAAGSDHPWVGVSISTVAVEHPEKEAAFTPSVQEYVGGPGEGSPSIKESPSPQLLVSSNVNQSLSLLCGDSIADRHEFPVATLFEKQTLGCKEDTEVTPSNDVENVQILHVPDAGVLHDRPTEKQEVERRPDLESKPSMLGKREVGRFLRLYWCEDEEWFVGKVLAYDEDADEYQIEYESDGDVEQLDLRVEKFEWLSDPPPGVENEIVGWRISIFWTDDHASYPATVTGYNEITRLHFVHYDDGDVEEVDLSQEKVRYLEKTREQHGPSLSIHARGDQPPMSVDLPQKIPVKCGELQGMFDPLTASISCPGRTFTPKEFADQSGMSDGRSWEARILVLSAGNGDTCTLGSWLEKRNTSLEHTSTGKIRGDISDQGRSTSGNTNQGGMKGHRAGCKCAVCQTIRRRELEVLPTEPENKQQKPKVVARRHGKRVYIYALEQLPRGLSCHFPEQLPPSKCWSPDAWQVRCSSEVLACETTHNKDLEKGGRAALTLKEKLATLARTEMSRVAFGKSGIHGWGLIARTPIKKDDMVIEYRGVVIRSVLADLHEQRHRKVGKDCYLFSVDQRTVVDATDCGSPSRFINHCCNPSLFTRVIEVDSHGRLVFFARRNIKVGEELTFDYRFEKEDEESKIPCFCGAPNCRGTMN